MLVVPQATLDGYVGKHIRDICTTGLTGNEHNHCAHFVSHVEGLRFGLVCGDMASSAASRHQGATIRVNEVYNNCPYRGLWTERPVPLIYCLIFVTAASNVPNGQMGTHRHKHMGIWSHPFVYEYSNQAGGVLKDASPDAFFTRLRGHYPERDLALYYGYIP